MPKSEIVELRLPADFVGQILDGLEVLAEDWEFTADGMGMCQSPEEGDRHVRDCSRPSEARKIATLYREIIARIRDQREVK
jgi:hypothetical protein